MTTVTTLIDDALQWMGVSSILMPAEPEEQQRVWRTAQALFSILPKRNVYLRLQRPASVSADILEPEWATFPLAVVLADLSAEFFRVDFTPRQLEKIDEMWGLLRNKAGKPIQAYYPPYRNHDFRYFYPGQNDDQIQYWDIQNREAIKTYTFDFTDEVTRRGTSLSSVAVTNIGVKDATIGTPSTSSGVVTSQVTFPEVGRYLLEARGTFASGDIYDIFIQVDVVDQANYYRADN